MKRDCTFRVAKTRALISFAELICVFVFVYANCWFSHDAVQFLLHTFDSIKLKLQFESTRYMTDIPCGENTLGRNNLNLLGI